jgi:hypothetical protein
MSSQELSEWMAYDRLEPIGWARVDLIGGLICSLLANSNRKRGAAPFKPSDFMPFLEKPEVDPLDAEAVKALFAPFIKPGR